MNKSDIINRWNRLADEYNQWSELGNDEKSSILIGADDLTDEDILAVRDFYE